MKIAFINTFEKYGGAGLAAYRLGQSLKSHTSAEIEYISQFKGEFKKYSPDNFSSLIRIGIDKLWLKKRLKNASDLYKFETGRLGIPLFKNPSVLSSDIIHLHWVQQGFLSINGIQRLAAIKPVIWTMHDMWPFTGGCCYSNDCTRYKEACGKCPYLKQPGINDLSYKIWKDKEILFRSGNITLVGPSGWITEKAAVSGLGRMSRVYHIPNPIDTQLFSPGEGKKDITGSGIAKGDFVLLFGAQNIDDERKGFGILEKALAQIKRSGFAGIDKIKLLVFGATEHPKRFKEIPVNVKYVGLIKKSEDLRKLYRASDWYVHPAIADNLPNTVVESISCGTPVMGFNSGGIKEIIINNYNGLIARGMNENELANLIIEAYESRDQIDAMRVNARNSAMENYSMEKVSLVYYGLYQKVLSGLGKN